LPTVSVFTIGKGLLNRVRVTAVGAAERQEVVEDGSFL